MKPCTTVRRKACNVFPISGLKMLANVGRDVSCWLMLTVTTVHFKCAFSRWTDLHTGWKKLHTVMKLLLSTAKRNSSTFLASDLVIIILYCKKCSELDPLSLPFADVKWRIDTESICRVTTQGPCIQVSVVLNDGLQQGPCGIDEEIMKLAPYGLLQLCGHLKYNLSESWMMNWVNVRNCKCLLFQPWIGVQYVNWLFFR